MRRIALGYKLTVSIRAPVRERSGGRTWVCRDQTVSIRAPVRERCFATLRPASQQSFNPRSCEGAIPHLHPRPQQSIVSIRAPVRERFAIAYQLTMPFWVSIRAPVRERCFHLQPIPFQRGFNPRSCEGAMGCKKRRINCRNGFNPRSCEGAIPDTYTIGYCVTVSIRAPVRERWDAGCFDADRAAVSIRAPVRERSKAKKTTLEL